MAKRPGQVEYMRLKSLLLKDKVSAPAHLAAVIKSDIFTVLQNYLEVVPDDLEVNLDSADGFFKLHITAKSRRIKQVGALPKEI